LLALLFDDAYLSSNQVNANVTTAFNFDQSAPFILLSTIHFDITVLTTIFEHPLVDPEGRTVAIGNYGIHRNGQVAKNAFRNDIVGISERTESFFGLISLSRLSDQ